MQVEITALSAEGRGIAQIEGKTTFIEGALLDEIVSFNYIKRHSRFDEAIVAQVFKASKERVEPTCKQFAICGGCSLQHISTEAQLSLKTKTLLDQLEHFGKVSPGRLLAPLLGDTFGYRRKARVGVKYVIKKNKVLIGFREKRSHKLADIEYCEVLDPRAASLLRPFADLVLNLEGRLDIRQIEIALGEDSQAWVIRHLAPLSDTDQAALLQFAIKHQLHWYYQPGNLASIHKVWPQDGVERLNYRLKDFNLELLFHPNDFTQVNSSINP